MGIPAEQLGMLFEPFNRLGAEHSGIEGAGVGLALTRKLARLMHSDIAVQSTVGEGSVFSFSLPVLALPAQPSPAAVTEDELATDPQRLPKSRKASYFECEDG